MAKTAKRLEPTITHDLTPQRTNCPHCGSPMRADYTNRRTLTTLKCVQGFAAFGASVLYRAREVELGKPPILSQLRADIDAVVRHWANEGIEVGSSGALEMDF